MNTKALRSIAIGLPLVHACALLLLMAFSGCTTQIKSDPTTFSVQEGAAPALRGQQRFALKNAYVAETKTRIVWQRGSSSEIDLKQYTDTALGALGREMTKNGITIDAAAPKSITLRVRDLSATMRMFPFVAVISSSLTLEAELGDGTMTAFRADSSSAGGAARAFDGAVVLAVTSLLNDKAFQTYVNRPLP